MRVGMAGLGLLVAASACSFEHGVLGGDGGLGDGGRDGRGDGPDAPIIDAPPAPLCDTSDSTLRACYDFEGDGVDQTANRNDATITGMSFVAGHRGMALETSSGTAIVANTTSLDVSMFSLRMWIKPTTLPTGMMRMGLLDSAGRYRLFLLANGSVRCAVTGGIDLITAVGKVTTGAWQRVTCTYDGQHMRIYVNGTVAGMLDQTSTIPTAGSGMVIGHNNPTGENFDGAIDELQVFSTVITSP